MATLEGQQLGAYEVLGQMGTGGMATVYKSYHARLDRHVAIKVMHEAFQQDAGFLARFEREAQIVARLEHPNIVPVYDFADLNGRPYLVMKYIEGVTLKARLFRQPPSLEDIRRMLPAIADALDYAHREGILHRDIKPSNILLDKASTPYLSDFGLARIAQLGESTLSQDVVLGTPQYISPEQAMGRRDLTSATDLYSFGVVIYEMIVGRVPFSSDTPFSTIHDHIYRPLPLPSAVNPQLTPAIDAALEKALAKSPEDRFENARTMVMAVLDALDAANLPSLDPNRMTTAAAALDRAREQQGSARVVMDDALTTPLPIQPITFASETPPPGVAISFTPHAPAAGEDGSPKAFSLKLPTVPQPPKAPNAPAAPNLPMGIPAAGRKTFNAAGQKVEMSWDLAQVDWRGLGRKVEAVFEDVGEHMDDAYNGTRPAEQLLQSDPASIRQRVMQEIKARNEFVAHLAAFIFVQMLLWTIFGISSDGDSFPWPLMVMFGWGAGLLAHGVETFYRTGSRLRGRLMRVERALIAEYGQNWSVEADKKQVKALRRKIEKPIDARIEFFQHFVVYVSIMSLLWTIFGLTNSEGVFLSDVDLGEMMPGGESFPWPLIPMFAWGFGLVMHGIQSIGTGIHEAAIEREVERERARVVSGKAKRTALPGESVAVRLDDLDAKGKRGVRIDEDGEFTDSMAQEVRADERRRR
ncbi:MAG: protein kinase [Chloroflexota bacterium]|nr:protein kinase [Chloroflexota bacterium]